MFTVSELIRATGGRLLEKKPKDFYFQGVSIDSRSIREEEIFLAIRGERFDGHDFIPEAIKKGIRCIIKEKNKKLTKPVPKNITVIEVEDTLRALGDLASFQRKKYLVPVIAVTGSNGKTTTKEMIASVLASRYRVLKTDGTKNNQIGVPMTLLRLKPEHELVVLELGTNHFGEIRYLAKISQPNIGLITNIAPAHLEEFKNLKGVFKEKSSLLDNLISPKISFLNSDDQFLRRLLRFKERNFFSFGIKSKCDFKASRLSYFNGEVSFLLNKRQRIRVHSCGIHNVYNALAAAAVGRFFGIGYTDISRVIYNFKFPEGRLVLKKINGVYFLDDTYNANPFSLSKALDALARIRIRGRRILVLADMLELGSKAEFFHAQAAKDIIRICDAFIGVGPLTAITTEEAIRYGMSKDSVFHFNDAKEAREFIFSKIKPKSTDLVLVKGSRRMGLETILN